MLACECDKMMKWLCTATQLLILCITVQTLCATNQLSSHHARENCSNTSVEDDSNIYVLALLPNDKIKNRSCSSADGRSKLSLRSERWDSGVGLLPAAELAVEHINKDPNTLSGHRLNLISVVDGCTSSTNTVTSFIKHVLIDRDKQKRSVIGVVGPTCSKSTIAIASIAGRGGLALPIVHTASSAELEDREKYPYTFGVLGSTLQLIRALFSFLHYNRIDKIAFLYEDSRAMSYVKHHLQKNEFYNSEEIVTFHSSFSDSFFPMETLQEGEANVVVVLSSLSLARKILCIAYTDGMLSPFYQWVIASHTYDKLKERNTTFYYHGVLYECNWATLELGTQHSALKHTLIVHFRLLPLNQNAPLVSGYSSIDIQQQYTERVCTDFNSSMCPIAQNSSAWVSVATTYDAVWALVLTIINTTTSSAAISYLKSWGLDIDKVRENIQHVNFRGATGKIHFVNKTGFVQRFVDIDRIHDGKAILIGSVYNKNVELYNNTEAIFITMLSQQYAAVNPYLAGFFVLLELFLLIVTVFFHVLYLVYRRSPAIKTSSPILNHFIFISCYLTVVSALLYILLIKTFGIPDFRVVGNVCHVLWAWLQPTIVTLGVGVLTMRTWRIYRIFIHFTNPGPLISNRSLVVGVLVQLTLDVIFGTAWTIISPVRNKIVRGESYMNAERQIVLQRQCVFTNTTYWLVTLAAYKLLQLVSLFTFCLLTRSVRNRRFRTSSLTAATYLLLLLSSVLIPLYAILWYFNAERHADFVVLCVFYSGTCVILLLFVLAPPTLPLLKCCRSLYIYHKTIPKSSST